MTYQDRYLYQTSQSQGEGKQEEQQRQQREQQGKSSGNLLETEIYSTATIWLSGGNRPTLYLPIDLSKYKIDKPCRIAFYDDNNNNGILIKFLHGKN